jgi:hypothetical protein
MAGLKITTGPMQGQLIECDRPLVIGREDVGEGVDVVIDDAQMSRRHAVLTPVAGGLQIEDLGSLNGTFVNGNRISSKVILEPDAEVRLGTTRFAVESPPADIPIASPSNATVVSHNVTQASGEAIAPGPPPTVIRGQPSAPATGPETPGEEPIPPGPPPTVVRGQPSAPATGPDAPSEAPIAPMAQPTVARSAPIVPDVDRTVVRDQPLISPQAPTVVRDVAKGLPTAQPPAGPGAPAGPPPKIPAPVRMVMRSPAGKLLLPIMLKLPPKARPLVPMLFLLLIVAAIAVAVILLVS